MNDIIKFKAKIKNKCYEKNDFKIYSCTIDSNEFPDIKTHPLYKTISILGDLENLILDTTYNIEAIPNLNKNKEICYHVQKIYKNKPTTLAETKTFLKEIITEKQTETLLKSYPNIINMIMENNLSEIDLNKTKGIKEKTFSDIKEKVVSNFCLTEIINEYSKFDINMNVLKKLYNKYSSINVIKDKLKNEAYKCLCGISGVGFKKADSIILKMNKDMINSKQRLEACIYYLLKQAESNGNTYMELKELHGECANLVPESISHFIEALNSENLYLDKKNKLVANIKTYECEVYIADKLREMLDKNNELKIEHSKYSKDLTQEQAQALENLCKYNVSLLIGFAGTGKSHSTRSIINMLDENNKSYLLLAPTGKSSKVLSEYTGKEAKTVHRGLEFNPQKGWGFNEKNQLPYDIIIVDEFSMLDILLFKNLLNAIDIDRTRILFIGDSSQIPSVSAGNISYDMSNSKIIPKTTLTKVFRYKDGGLAKVASDIREGKKFIDNEFFGVKNFGINKDYNLISITQEESIDEVLKIYKKLIKNGKSVDDVMALSAMNKNNYGTTEINKLIQQEINPRKENDKYIKYGDIEFRLGDKVIQIVNNYKARKDGWYEDVSVFNGNTGKIIYIDGFEMKVDFGDNVIVYEKDDVDQLRLGYCISIHKSQGSQSKNVILINPKSHKYFLNRNLLYTAITRASERVYHITTCDVINNCLNKSINLTRKTFLKELLT